MDVSVSKIVEIYQTIYPSRYASLAASAIIVYDHLLTLDNEMELIWKSSWSIGKVLFIINRYYTLISVIVNNYALFGTTLTNSGCLRFYHWQGWTGLIACMISETILQMRLYALYSLNKKILGLMVGSFLIASASAAAVLEIVLRQITAVSIRLPGLSSCIIATSPPSYFYAFWIPCLAFESLLCALALVRGFQTYRDGGSPSQSKLVRLLIRDSVCYYMVMFATYLTCLLIWIVNIDLLEVPIGFTIAFSCVLGNRVILNVRSAKRGVDESRGVRTDPYATNERGGLSLNAPISEHELGTLSDLEMVQLRTMKAKSVDAHI